MPTLGGSSAWEDWRLKRGSFDLEALAVLAAEGIGFEVVLAGDGPLRAALEARVRELALEGRVRITGWISNDGVRAELLAARAMLLPSFAEGLPVVLMEALALGRPAISTYAAGFPSCSNTA